MSTQTIEAPVETPIEVVKPLKLSEAIRLGSMGTQQAYGRWHEKTDEGVAMCAMSTAWFALTGRAEEDAHASALAEALQARHAPHPADPTVRDWSVASVIIDLNDQHRWPRHKIADWLEGLGL